MSKYAMGRLTQLNFGDEECECGVRHTCIVRTKTPVFMHTFLVAKQCTHVVMYMRTCMYVDICTEEPLYKGH